jgi:hypothetical protein
VDTGNVIAIFAVAIPVIAMIVGYIIKSKNDEIRLKDAKIDAQDVIIAEQRLQIAKLEITGTLVNKFFSQLPPLNSESFKREIQP